MIRIALVGDIGSGKSYFSKLFKFPIFNADLEVTKIYDKDKNLIAIASLANPVKKTETRDFMFKLKLDI